MVHVAAHWQLLRTVDSESHKQASGWARGQASERVADQRGRTDGQQIQRGRVGGQQIQRGRVCVQHLQRGGQLHQRGQRVASSAGAPGASAML